MGRKKINGPALPFLFLIPRLQTITIIIVLVAKILTVVIPKNLQINYTIADQALRMHNKILFMVVL